MEQAKVTHSDVVEAYDRIAREILGRPESAPNAIHNTLLKLAETHPGTVYWITRKFFQEYLKLYVADTGYIGIADRYVPGMLYPGDLVFYMLPENLQEGDIVQVIFTDQDEMRVYVVHGKVLSLREDGSVEVADIKSGDAYTVVPWNLLGKLARVVPFRSDEWNDLFPKAGVPEDWITTAVEETIRSVQDSGMEDTEAVMSELKSRLADLVH